MYAIYVYRDSFTHNGYLCAGGTLSEDLYSIAYFSTQEAARSYMGCFGLTDEYACVRKVC